MACVQQWPFIKDQLLRRLLWTLMTFDFKKMPLRMTSITAVHWVHEICSSVLVKVEGMADAKKAVFIRRLAENVKALSFSALSRGLVRSRYLVPTAEVVFQERVYGVMLGRRYLMVSGICSVAPPTPDSRTDTYVPEL